MANNFRLDARALQRALRHSPQAVSKGAATALADIKDDWVADSVDIAPIDTANLRRQIHGDVINPGMNGRVKITAPAVRDGFNYAYYIHELDAGGNSVNGEKKFLDAPAEANIDKWEKWLTDEVTAELRKVGW